MNKITKWRTEALQDGEWKTNKSLYIIYDDNNKPISRIDHDTLYDTKEDALAHIEKMKPYKGVCPIRVKDSIEIDVDLYNSLYNIKKPIPTLDELRAEIIEGLSEYFKEEVVYENNLFNVYDCKNQKTWGRQSREISLDELYDVPHLITMIGKFYAKEQEK